MYSKEQLTKTFQDTAKFFKLPVELAKIDQPTKDHYIFYVKELGERIDPKSLQEELAKTLRVTTEVRFLGAREKAQEVGGCGPCGRQLCCASWLRNIPPVKNDALKGQQFSDASEYLGMCGKLRCCLAYLSDDFKLLQQEQPATSPLRQSFSEASPPRLSKANNQQPTTSDQQPTARENDHQEKVSTKKKAVKKPEKKRKFTRTLNIKPKRKKKRK